MFSVLHTGFHCVTLIQPGRLQCSNRDHNNETIAVLSQVGKGCHLYVLL